MGCFDGGEIVVRTLLSTATQTSVELFEIGLRKSTSSVFNCTEYVLFLPAEQSGGYTQKARSCVNLILLFLGQCAGGLGETGRVGLQRPPSHAEGADGRFTGITALNCTGMLLFRSPISRSSTVREVCVCMVGSSPTAPPSHTFP